MENFAEISITLKLTQAEAQWLKGLVQNTRYGSLESEPESERKIRLSFWNALKDTPL